jgi:hypothetical protein
VPERPCRICGKTYEIDFLIAFRDGEVCETCYEKGREEWEPPEPRDSGDFESDPVYRRDMIDAGRGHLLR